MVVGICSIQLIMFENHSLKEKRHLIKSIIEKIKHRYNVSIAEVGEHEKWQRSEIGIACVSNDKKHVDGVLQKIISYIDQDGRFDMEISQYEIF
ncbi:DUF503 domain-containing protein [Isachenkonia alkalipeptolytica]|uniref:DUF503 domain-containing protein n=1 Tax=Isachenkonia alkalipeptolytica TaxID=2565777 RepID=A0AA44BG76_9CLOT|nr:DUF503 domain-containing protein [Isachenkonia alkalipeptolytica]NBG89171.1 DUF503 domain-containing protein [Isachenkonia alkalipeptolytica]